MFDCEPSSSLNCMLDRKLWCKSSLTEVSDFVQQRALCAQSMFCTPFLYMLYEMNVMGVFFLFRALSV